MLSAPCIYLAENVLIERHLKSAGTKGRTIWHSAAHANDRQHWLVGLHGLVALLALFLGKRTQRVLVLVLEHRESSLANGDPASRLRLHGQLQHWLAARLQTLVLCFAPRSQKHLFDVGKAVKSRSCHKRNTPGDDFSFR